MLNKIDNLLAVEVSLKATLAEFNRQWNAARAAFDVRLMRDLDRRCNLVEILLAENSDAIDTARAELEFELAWLEQEAADIDNIRAAAMDAGDVASWHVALNDLSDIAREWDDAFWTLLFAEHDTLGKGFAA